MLSSRAAFLVETGAARANGVLCITFTNRAAREMRERMLAIGSEMCSAGPFVSPDTGRGDANVMADVECGTFHSICLRLLRRYAHTLPSLGLRKNFTVYDTDDASVLIKAILDDAGASNATRNEQMASASDDGEGARANATTGSACGDGESTGHGTDSAQSEAATADRMLNMISLSRNLLASSYNRSGESLAAVLREHDISAPPNFARVYDAYARMKRKLNVVDFDDLLHMAVAVMKFGQLAADDNGRKVNVLSVLQERWQHILVDEFQDTNKAQYNFIYELMAGNDNRERRRNTLFVVGDADQSIFGWRGAHMENISRALTRDFHDSIVTYKLETNYRSSSSIVDAAKAILPASWRKPPGGALSSPEGHDEDESGEGTMEYGASEMRLVSHVRDVGVPVKIFAANSDQHEADVVAREIIDLVSSGAGARAALDEDTGGAVESLRWKDVAVLYRTRMQARALEEACIKNDVPYELISGTPFFNRREIKDLIAYLRIVNNLNDDVALDRVLNVPPRGIGAKTIEKLRAWADGTGAPLGVLLGFEGMLNDEGAGDVRDWEGEPATNGLGASVVKDNSLPAPADIGVSAKAHKAVVHFSGMLRRLQDVASTRSAADVLEAVIREVGYWEYIQNNFSARKSTKKHSKLVRKAIDDRISNVQELVAIARQAGDLALPTFLENVSMYGSEGDNSVDLPDIAAALAGPPAVQGDECADDGDGGTDRVKLMTIHMSKGLEFGAVFLTGFERNLIPLQSTRDEGEERRLVYVAMTRAKRHLYITRAQWRSMYGRRQFMKESPFSSALLMAGEGLSSNRQYHEEEWIEL